MFEDMGFGGAHCPPTLLVRKEYRAGYLIFVRRKKDLAAQSLQCLCFVLFALKLVIARFGACAILGLPLLLGPFNNAFRECSVANKETLIEHVLLSVLGVLSAFVLCEFIVRATFEPPMFVEIKGTDLSSRRPFEGKLFSHESMYRMTSAGPRLRSSAVVNIRNHPLGEEDVEIHINSLGLRGPELQAKVFPRILFLGDSVTIQDYLRDEDTFVNLARRELFTRGVGAELLNGGVAGLNMEQELILLKEVGPKISPDAVVIVFCLNDILPSRTMRFIAAPRLLKWSWFLNHLLLGISFRFPIEDPHTSKEVLSLWREEAKKNLSVDRPSREYESYANVINSSWELAPSWGDSPWLKISILMEQFYESAVKLNSTPLLAVSPLSVQVEATFVEDFPQRKLESLTSRAGVRFLNMLPPMRTSFQQARTPLFYDLGHLNKHGSRVVAEVMAGFIADNLLEP